MYSNDKRNLIIAQSANKRSFDYRQAIIRKTLPEIAYRLNFIIFREALSANHLSFKQLNGFIENNSSRPEN